MAAFHCHMQFRSEPLISSCFFIGFPPDIWRKLATAIRRHLQVRYHFRSRIMAKVAHALREVKHILIVSLETSELFQWKWNCRCGRVTTPTHNCSEVKRQDACRWGPVSMPSAIRGRNQFWIQTIIFWYMFYSKSQLLTQMFTGP